MSYNLILFAANGAQLAEQVRTDDSLLERTLQHIRELDVYNSDDLVIFADILRAGLGGNWPDDGTMDTSSQRRPLADSTRSLFDGSNLLLTANRLRCILY